MEATNAFWKDQWVKMVQHPDGRNPEILSGMGKTMERLVCLPQTADMQETSAYWKQLWATWFNEYTNNNTSEMAAWRENAQALFDEWFQQLKDTLSEGV